MVTRSDNHQIPWELVFEEELKELFATIDLFNGGLADEIDESLERKQRAAEGPGLELH